MPQLERHLFVVLLWIATGVSFVAHALTAPERIPIAAGLIALLIVWVHLVHRVHSWEVDALATNKATIATLGLMVGFAALVAVDGSYLFMLFGVYSFLFGYSTDLRRAAILSGLLTAAWIVAWIAYDLPAGAIATPIFVWGVANAINVLSTRISRQNAERGELITRLQRTQDELATAERERGVLEERQRLAREIHDTLAQGFTSVVLLTEAMQKQLDSLPPERLADSLALLASTGRQNLDEARRLIDDQTPVALEDRSLPRALQLLADDLSRRIDADVTVDLPDGTGFGGTEDVVLLRVAQESCANISKYADASHVSISLTFDDTHATLCIADDGYGFDPSQPQPTTVSAMSGGSGLTNMAERVRELDGTFDIRSSPGDGTTVIASIPIIEVHP